MTRTRLVFSGSGGQGVITAAIILAEAAVLYENLNAVQSQDYGAEARGGATRSDVIISDAEIFYPKVVQPNILVCLTQSAYNKYRSIIRPGGLLLTDSRFVTLEKKVDAHQEQLSLWDSVASEIGNPVVFNICMLGALIARTQLVSPGAIVKVLETRLPASVMGMNRRALELGMHLASPQHPRQPQQSQQTL
jgi:2-oxoglutarate ferredoxin oxidoreductase subunit gamma